MKKKICIIGSKRVGKDTVASILSKNYGFKCKSSSEAALEIFLLDVLRDEYGLDYKNTQDAINHKNEDDSVRAVFYQEIKRFNKHNKARLAELIMDKNEIYTGMRDRAELVECLKEGVFDIVLGVTRDGVKEESKKSNNIVLERDADLIIENNGDLQDLEIIVGKVAERYLIS